MRLNELIGSFNVEGMRVFRRGLNGFNTLDNQEAMPILSTRCTSLRRERHLGQAESAILRKVSVNLRRVLFLIQPAVAGRE